ESFPGLPPEISPVAPSLELERRLARHCHGSPPAPSQSHAELQACQKLGIACAICFVFMIGEVVEMLGALASVLSIWVVTGVLVYLASARIISNDYEINARAMLVTSACAVGVNIIPGCCAVRAAFVHVVGDLLQSLGVLTAATVIYMEPQYKIADPVSTFLFSVFVLGSTVSILRDVFRVLMEGAPRGVEFSAVKDVLLAVKDVKDAHNLHLWTLTLSHHMVSVHVAVGAGADMEDVLQEATAQLQSTFGFISCTVQVERYLEDMAACRQCQDPQD
uniref:Probable proton-coupled zinc antiporter SLC30A3 n=1 Tax=Chelonoidis abingdonii TaxID=106734 RepID=A0A8C0H8Z9_CHEAB